MKNNFAGFILKTFGWKTNDTVETPTKCIICVAPHTTNWDFIFGLLYKWNKKLKANFFIKKEWFTFPFGSFMKSVGGIPIDRSKKSSTTDQMAEAFSTRENLCIAIAPEGTRKATAEWKKGFYYIAAKANVPIALAFIDYKHKEVGIGKIITPTGNIEEDMKIIKDFYKTINAKHPQNFIY